MEKVDERTREKWNESQEFSTLPSWSSCLQIVERHCQYLESTSTPDSTTFHKGTIADEAFKQSRYLEQRPSLEHHQLDKSN